jgi:hypothetical protein
LSTLPPRRIVDFTIRSGSLVDLAGRIGLSFRDRLTSPPQFHMHIADWLSGRHKPTLVAAVYGTRESAVEAAEAAKRDALADDEDVRIIGPLEEVIGNTPSPRMRGTWAVVVQPNTYEQCKRIVRALRVPVNRRRSDRARQDARAQAQSKSPAAAGLLPDRP